MDDNFDFEYDVGHTFVKLVDQYKNEFYAGLSTASFSIKTNILGKKDTIEKYNDDSEHK